MNRSCTISKSQILLEKYFHFAEYCILHAYCIFNIAISNTIGRVLTYCSILHIGYCIFHIAQSQILLEKYFHFAEYCILHAYCIFNIAISNTIGRVLTYCSILHIGYCIFHIAQSQILLEKYYHIAEFFILHAYWIFNIAISNTIGRVLTFCRILHIGYCIFDIEQSRKLLEKYYHNAEHCILHAYCVSNIAISNTTGKVLRYCSILHITQSQILLEMYQGWV